jgi:hypothetical protein
MAEVYKLSNDSLAMIVKSLQYGILTGVDVTDLFRALAFNVNDSGELDPTEETVATFDAEVQTQLDRIPELLATQAGGE